MATNAQSLSFGQNVNKLLRRNIREYGMYIALFVIMVFFDITSKGLFLSARNISDLINQTGYIAVLAVGMTLVIVIRHIDLSVGFLAGFLGAVAAIAMVYWHLPAIAAILLVLCWEFLPVCSPVSWWLKSKSHPLWPPWRAGWVSAARCNW